MNIGINLDPFDPWTYAKRLNLAYNLGTATGLTQANGTQTLLYAQAIPAAGTYTVSFTGTGTITIAGVTIKAAASAPVQLTPLINGGLYTITIAGSISTISIMPEGVTVDAWSPAFLKAIAPFACLRMMQPTRANYTNETIFSSRVLPTVWSWTQGLPWEWVIDLANITGKDVWVNVPVGFTADYLAGMSSLFAAKLTNPACHVYTEFGNEVWNTSGAIGIQTAKAMTASKSLPNPISDAWENLAAYSASQSRAIGKAFLAAGLGVVPVYASCAASPDWPQKALTWLKNNGGISPIALVACAPYLDDAGTAGESTAQVLADLAGVGMTNAVSRINAFVATIKPFGLPVACYECGTECYPNNDANRIAAQFDPGMVPIYAKYLPALATAGVTLACHYMLASGDTFAAAKSLSDVTSPKIAALIAAAGTSPPPVQTAPVITLQPQSQAVTAGATVTFTAAANGVPVPTCQWQVLGSDGKTWVNLASALGPVLIVASAASSETIRAVFTNAAGTATTNPATLTVNPVALPTGSGDKHAWYIGQDSVTSAMRTVSIF